MKKNIGLTQAAQLIQSKELDSKVFLADSFETANELEPNLKSFVNRSDFDYLIKQVKPGPLSGIPIGIKDIINTVDFPTTNGSPIYKGHTPVEDAEVVKKIRNLGGVIFGKTVTTQFAWRTPGPTTNPHNKAHTPGGSSSGSAAAVAAGIVPLAIGTQTVGSIVRPAAFCGVVGFKPSYGAVSKVGTHPLSFSLDHIGFFARSVDDVAYAFQLLKNDHSLEVGEIVIPDLELNTDNKIFQSQPSKIAFLETPFDHLLSNEQRGLINLAILNLGNSGIVIERLRLPDEYWNAIQSLHLIMEVEAAQIHGNHMRYSFELLCPNIKELVEKGLQHTAEDYQHALILQQKLRQSIGHFFAEFDALLTAPATGEAPKGLEWTGDPIFCALASFLGIPSITIPIGKSKNGLPLGVQLIGNYKEDAKLLGIAKFSEQVLI